ncbi:MAG: adenosine deaminase [Candidatus Zixiibacteriota bacterium]|jgi:adenosine deaminase
MAHGSRDKLIAFARKIPKAELHLHLEGAIPLDTLFGLIRRAGTEPGIRNVDDLRAALTYPNFQGFLNAWVWKNGFVAEEDDFRTMAYEVLRDLAADNVRHVEMHYSPGDFADRGFTTAGVTEAVIEGLARGERDFGVTWGLIVDLFWSAGEEAAARRVEEAAPYLGRGVVGVGMGGNEQYCPASTYVDVYREARRLGFRLTAHAGEALGPESVRSALDELQLERIGHGVRAVEDAALVDELAGRGVPLEVCVVSNVMTGVYEAAAQHPVRELFDRGVMVTVNSDDPTMFHSSPANEYAVLARELGFTREELKTLSLNGVAASFLPEEEKAALRARFEEEWAAI